MASSKRASRPPKRDNRDYSIDDFVNPTGFEHMFSFLNVRRPTGEKEPPALLLTEPTKALTGLQCPDPDTQSVPAGNEGLVGRQLQNPATPDLRTPKLGTPNLATCHISTPVL